MHRAYERIGEARELVDELARDNPRQRPQLERVLYLLKLEVPEPSQVVVEAIFRDGEETGYERARRELSGQDDDLSAGRQRQHLRLLPGVACGTLAEKRASAMAWRVWGFPEQKLGNSAAT